MEFFSRLWETFANARITFQLADAVEILIMMLLLYKLLIWARKERTWIVVKAIIAIAVLFGIAKICQFNTILFLASKSLDFLLLAVIVVFQPELRKFLEKIGTNDLISSLFPSAKKSELQSGKFNEESVQALVNACYYMGKNKTGALIVIEQKIPLKDIVTSGIPVDAVISSQLLINIFEHNTPLHDGAVVIKGNRILAATCYLPNSKSSKISKAYGTRHRSAIGLSERTDALTIIVSEETGAVSMTENGAFRHNVSASTLKNRLTELIEIEEKEPAWRWLRWRSKDEKDQKN